MLLAPWLGVAFLCLIVSWYSLFVIGLDAIVAPVMKLWFLLKPVVFKSIPALFLFFWSHTGAKLLVLLTELTELIIALLGGIKAWSVKKLASQFGKFVLSLSARFVAINVLYNLLFGHERRSIKLLPGFAMHRLHRSKAGSVVTWWRNRTERHKRLVYGLVVCLILVLAGHAMLGVSILLFDLVWELVLLLWRLLKNLWRLLGPVLLKLIPNWLGNFFTQTVLPMVASVVPVIKDDYRVIYLHFYIRRQVRKMKAWLYLKSRARRSAVRGRITPIVGENFRAKKAALIVAVVQHSDKPRGRPGVD